MSCVYVHFEESYRFKYILPILNIGVMYFKHIYQKLIINFTRKFKDYIKIKIGKDNRLRKILRKQNCFSTFYTTHKNKMQ